MKSFFSDEILQEVRHTIWMTLVDTFKIMFEIDVLVVSESLSPNDQAIYSHTRMQSDETVVYLSIAIAKTLVNLICERLQPRSKNFLDEIGQDVVSEVTNIICNHLRAKLYEKLGVSFDFSIPINGKLVETKPDEELINVVFNISEEKHFKMKMTHTEKNGKVLTVA